MMNLVALPILVPLLTAIAAMPLLDRPAAQRTISLITGASLILLTAFLVAATAGGEVFVLPVGNWPPLVGIVWVIDGLSALLLLATAITSFATLVYAPAALRPGAEQRYFYLLHQFILTGINGTFITGDFFNLFVFFEIMLLASFVLLALGGRPEQMKRSFPYVMVNLVASSLFLGGLGVVYGTAGTVNMAVLAERVASGILPPAFWAGITLVLSVFVIKAAVAPVFFWLPDAYPEAPIPVRAFFAGLLTKVGLYTLFRSLPLVFGSSPGAFHSVLLVLAALTMLAGILGALGRRTLKEMLSFQIVSSVGFIVFGLAVYTPAAVAAGIFYMVHSVLITTALFFAGGVVERIGGSGTVGEVRGLARTHPWLAACFFISLLALAGLPPFSGFWAKMFLLIGGFAAGEWAVAGVLLLASLLTYGLIMRLWSGFFWGEPTVTDPGPGNDRGLMGATIALSSAAIVLAILVAPLWGFSERVATDLLEVRPYIDAVMEQSPPLLPVALEAGGDG